MNVKNPGLAHYGARLLADRDAAALVHTKLELIWNLRVEMRTRGFVEAPMPILHRRREGAPVHQFVTENPLTGERYYLRHSMEDHLRRLSGVFPRLFEIGKAIRAEVEDDARAEEFLLMEAGARDLGFTAGVELVTSLLSAVLRSTLGDHNVCSEVDAMKTATFNDLAAEALDVPGFDDDDALVAAAESHLSAAHGITFGADASGWQILEDFMKHTIEPACVAPTLIAGFPPPLRHISPVDPATGLATRFSLIWKGVEFCDGGLKFGTAAEYREVHEKNAELRAELIGTSDNDLAEEFFADVEASPGGSFTFGLGLDRLMALVAGTSIHEVIQFPFH